MDEFVLARVLHVLGVVFWIGGVSMITTVLLPNLMRESSAPEAMQFFKQFRKRFAAQARILTLVVGVTGFYMIHVLDAWYRFMMWQYWWMHTMVFVWLVFSIMLFILEPRSRNQANISEQTFSIEAFKRAQRMHMIMLTLSLLTIAGAVAGSHGWLPGS